MTTVDDVVKDLAKALKDDPGFVSVGKGKNSKGEESVVVTVIHDFFDADDFTLSKNVPLVIETGEKVKAGG